MKALTAGQCLERLSLIFPDGIVEDRGRVVGRLPAAAVFVALFCGAIEEHRPLRPSMVLWMSDAVVEHVDGLVDEERDAAHDAWYRAALRGRKALNELVASWDVDNASWYADNSRETLRDEVFREFRRVGAIIRDPRLATTSPSPAWTLRGTFAALFSPNLQGPDLADAVSRWQDEHLGKTGLLRRRLNAERDAAGAGVLVRLPNGTTRNLAAGDSSIITKAVIEQMAPLLLGAPAVITLSESSNKVDVLDAALLDDVGITIRVSDLLPDVVLFDAEDGSFWFVEVVATAGEIHEERRGELLAWAAGYGIGEDRCRFVTAFLSRSGSPFGRRMRAVAWGTLVWCADAPQHVIDLRSI